MNNKNNSMQQQQPQQRRMAIGLAVLLALVISGIGLVVLGLNAIGSKDSPIPAGSASLFTPEVKFAQPGATVGPTAPQPVNAVVATQAAPVTTMHPDGAIAGIADFVCPKPHPAPEKFGYGIQSNWAVGDMGNWNNVMADQLKVTWTKAQVRWSEFEKEKGKIVPQVDANSFDAFVADANKKGLNIVIGVIQAPAWARKLNEPGLLGPPDDYADAARFFGKITARYRGCIQAVEIWNEMNLDREWRVSSGQIAAADYVRYLKAVVPVIKKYDPNLITVMGALSPVGYTTVGKFQDDYTYMDDFVAAGGPALVDCIGVHLNGYNYPPDKTWDSGYKDPTATFRGPFDSPSHDWSFLSTFTSYYQKTKKPLCVTEFGWPSMDGLKRRDGSPLQGAPEGFGFALDNTEKKQADWIVQGFDILRKSGYVKFGIVFNLDYIVKIGEEPDNKKANVAPYSVVRRDGSTRPAFEAIKLIKKD